MKKTLKNTQLYKHIHETLLFKSFLLVNPLTGRRQTPTHYTQQLKTTNT